MKVPPAYTGEQTLIRGRREMSPCLQSWQGQEAAGVQYLRLDPLLVEQIDEVKILREGLASSSVPKICSLSHGRDATH